MNHGATSIDTALMDFLSGIETHQVGGLAEFRDSSISSMRPPSGAPVLLGTALGDDGQRVGTDWLYHTDAAGKVVWHHRDMVYLAFGGLGAVGAAFAIYFYWQKARKIPRRNCFKNVNSSGRP